jgi:NADH-quinone oxidoreductase subunit G
VAIGDPALQATVPDIEYAHAVLLLDVEPVDDMAILDLRIRKGVRRNNVKLAIASARPSALDPSAALSLRFAPGGGPAFAADLTAAARGERDRNDGDAHALFELLDELRGAGEDIVIVASERVGGALAPLADALGLRDRAGAGLIIVPSTANGRGLREVGVLPDAGPGLSPVAETGLHAVEMPEAAAAGRLTALWLMGVDPLRDLPDRARWAQALDRVTTVVAHASFLTEGVRAHADVVFPAEAYAEKDGTLTHPDGRLQRVRPAIGHQGRGRYGYQVLNDLAKRMGLDLRVLTSGMALAQLAAAVPFYAGVTLDEIGGRGLRWPEREAAAAYPAVDGPGPLNAPLPTTDAGDGLRLGTFRSIWASPEVEHSPALHFLKPHQRAEMAPDDADRLGLADGTPVIVSANGSEVRARVALRATVPSGAVFLQDGLDDGDSANALTGSIVQVRRGTAHPTSRPGTDAPGVVR